VSKFIDQLGESIRRGDLSGAFRNQLASLREQTEAVEAGFQELEARIKEIEARIKGREARIKDFERISRSSPGSKANSRKHRSLEQIVGLWRRRKTKRRPVTAVGVGQVIRLRDQGGNFSGFLALLGTAGPSVPESISEGAVHSPSLAKQQTRRENT
jgi:hypothetical protein